MLADGTPARELLYADFPRRFTWKLNRKTWRERKIGLAIGRMHSVRPNDHERFYLRLLLNHVHGATSFEDMRTVTRNGRTVTYGTFVEVLRLICRQMTTGGDRRWRRHARSH